MLEVQGLHKFSDMNWFDKIITVLKVMQPASNNSDYFKWICGFTVVAFGIVFVSMVFIEFKSLTQKIIYYVAMSLAMIILLNMAYVYHVASTNIGIGYYKADVKVQNIKTIENVSGKQKTTFEIKDKNNRKIKLEYQGHKLSKGDKIQVKTQKDILNGNEPKQKAFDLLGKDNYTYSYQGHKLKSDDVRELGRGLFNDD